MACVACSIAEARRIVMDRITEYEQDVLVEKVGLNGQNCDFL